MLKTAKDLRNFYDLVVTFDVEGESVTKQAS
jgi:hypothetical protein